MTKAAIINLGFGNLYGLDQALKKVGFDSNICDTADDMSQYDALILPGVGSFGNGISRLVETGWKEVIEKWVEQERPLLGICLGMQLLFEKSHEFGEYEGFGFFKGSVIPIHHNEGEAIPKIGWYHLNAENDDASNTIKSVGLKHDKPVYFVHSYGAKPVNENDVIASVTYSGHEYAAIVNNKNIWGAQFHPENSHNNGLGFLKFFLDTVEK